MRRKRERGVAGLVAVGVAALVGWIGFHFQQWRIDRPVADGIIAYRAGDREARMSTYCACGHRGYYIVTGRCVLWYVEEHGNLNLVGEILSRDTGRIRVRQIERTPGLLRPEGDGTLIDVDGGVEVRWPDRSFRLKRTFLDASVREKVEAFDFDHWVEERDERWRRNGWMGDGEG